MLYALSLALNLLCIGVGLFPNTGPDFVRGLWGTLLLSVIFTRKFRGFFLDLEKFRPDTVVFLLFVALVELTLLVCFNLGVVFAIVLFFGLHFFFGLLVYLPFTFRCSVCHQTLLST